jgi:NAD(P)-dependent dehydrogenase (short-subunit alcohol dehydrogenase family)
LTKTAAVENGKYGIRVNAVSPAAVRTQMLLDVFGNEEALDRMGAVHPLGRIGRPEEIADAVAWLFSDRSSYYTGQSLTLDGGLTAQRPMMQSRVAAPAEGFFEAGSNGAERMPSSVESVGAAANWEI